MIFSRKKKEVIDPYTVEKCNTCTVIAKRKFMEGDYVFKTMRKCESCDKGQIMVSKIFGEVIK